MNVRVFKVAFLLFFIINAINTEAKVKLPSILADNMVLQQQTEVKLWGSAERNKTVEVAVSWTTEKYTTTADTDGKWLLKVRTPKAGGPHTLTFNDGAGSVTLKNVMTGEVWLCAGQSNMRMTLSEAPKHNQFVLNGEEIIAQSDNPNIRFMRLNSNPSLTPLDDVKPSWKPWRISSPETSGQFSAVAYQYADMLQKKLGVPVGIIVAAYGGAKIECWMGKEVLKSFPDVKIPETLEKVDFSKDSKQPTVLFNCMISPLTNFTIKGWLWYQGETNARDNPDAYRQLFPAMVADWRKHWDSGELPFYYVETAPAASVSKALVGNRVKMRYIQQQAMKNIPNSGAACIIDAGMPIIHPMDKTTVAQRLVYWALGHTYGVKGIAYRSPLYKSHKTKGNKLVVSFEKFASGMTSNEKDITLFEVAGSDGQFYPAEAVITKAGDIVVTAKEVKKPVDVRYAWKDWVVGEIYNTEGLPLPSFTTQKL